MLSKIFGAWSRPVQVDINELFQRLELHHKRFKQYPDMHLSTLDGLGKFTLRGSSLYGPGMAYISDPKQKIIIKARPKTFSDEPDPVDDEVPGSAYISWTEESRSFGRRAFALLIRDRATSYAQTREAIVFGLYGVYDKQGKLSVQKLMVPGKDSANRMTPTQSIKITEKDVQGALLYAEYCAKAIYSGEGFQPRLCLDRSMSVDLDTEAMRIIGPAPKA